MTQTTNVPIPYGSPCDTILMKNTSTTYYQDGPANMNATCHCIKHHITTSKCDHCNLIIQQIHWCKHFKYFAHTHSYYHCQYYVPDGMRYGDGYIGGLVYRSICSHCIPKIESAVAILGPCIHFPAREVLFSRVDVAADYE